MNPLSEPLALQGLTRRHFFSRCAFVCADGNSNREAGAPLFEKAALAVYTDVLLVERCNARPDPASTLAGCLSLPD